MRDARLVLTSLISDWASQTPDRVFMQEVGGSSLTYRQYDETIRRWAEAYRRLGQPGSGW
jgi:acyl-CoA synthetase (AMP-forming)/AMP-acid ligase II